MTDRDTFISMLQRSRIDFGYEEGDIIVGSSARFSFDGPDNSLRGVKGRVVEHHVEIDEHTSESWEE